MNQPTPSATEPAAEQDRSTATARAFVDAIAAKDATRLRGLLATPLRFRAITPRRFWEAETAPDAVDEIVLGTWFDDAVTVLALEDVAIEDVQDLKGVRYRMRVLEDDVEYVVEQSGYLRVNSGVIDDVRLVCSGFIPA